MYLIRRRVSMSKKTANTMKILAACLIPGGFAAYGAYLLLSKCWHSFTMPITNKATKDTYVVCTKCGVEYNYDLVAMKMGRKRVRNSAGTTSIGTRGLDEHAGKAKG